MSSNVIWLAGFIELLLDKMNLERRFTGALVEPVLQVPDFL